LHRTGPAAQNFKLGGSGRETEYFPVCQTQEHIEALGAIRGPSFLGILKKEAMAGGGFDHL